MTKKAQVVLVHGAWADGTCWGRVILLLQATGITATTPAYGGLRSRSR